MKNKAGKGLAFRQISLIFASNNASRVAYVAHQPAFSLATVVK